MHFPNKIFAETKPRTNQSPRVDPFNRCPFHANQCPFASVKPNPIPLDVCSTWQPCSNINSYQGFGIHFQSNSAAPHPPISFPLAQLLFGWQRVMKFKQNCKQSCAIKSTSRK